MSQIHGLYLSEIHTLYWSQLNVPHCANRSSHQFIPNICSAYLISALKLLVSRNQTRKPVRESALKPVQFLPHSKQQPHHWPSPLSQHVPQRLLDVATVKALISYLTRSHNSPALQADLHIYLALLTYIFTWCLLTYIFTWCLQCLHALASCRQQIGRGFLSR